MSLFCPWNRMNIFSKQPGGMSIAMLPSSHNQGLHDKRLVSPTALTSAPSSRKERLNVLGLSRDADKDAVVARCGCGLSFAFLRGIGLAALWPHWHLMTLLTALMLTMPSAAIVIVIVVTVLTTVLVLMHLWARSILRACTIIATPHSHCAYACQPRKSRHSTF